MSFGSAGTPGPAGTPVTPGPSVPIDSAVTAVIAAIAGPSVPAGPFVPIMPQHSPYPSSTQKKRQGSPEAGRRSCLPNIPPPRVVLFDPVGVTRAMPTIQSKRHRHSELPQNSRKIGETRLVLFDQTHLCASIPVPLPESRQVFKEFKYDETVDNQPTFRAFSKWHRTSRVIVFRHKIKSACWGNEDGTNGLDVTPLLNTLSVSTVFNAQDTANECCGNPLFNFFHHLVGNKNHSFDMFTLTIEYDLADRQDTMFFENWSSTKFELIHSSRFQSTLYGECIKQVFQPQLFKSPHPRIGDGLHAIFKGSPLHPPFYTTIFTGHVLF